MISKEQYYELHPDTPMFVTEPSGYMENTIDHVHGRTIGAVMMKYKFMKDFVPPSVWYLYDVYKNGDHYIIRYAV
jgi:hypothetical protein